MKVVFIIFLLTQIKQNLTENSQEDDSIQMGNTDENNNLDIFSKCYDVLGCVDTDSRWYDKKYRTVNFKPAERHIIKTDFLLIKPSQEEPDNLIYNSVVAKEKSLNASGFEFEASLMILIHDFTGNGYTGWVKHVAYTVFINAMETNVISVDWQRGAEPPYDQAIANARVVALEISHFIKELKTKYQYSLDDIQIVGHGVGAHIAGYVGANVEGIRKITGLDPSGPRFEGMPDIVKLHPNNAKYVEVIHTDAHDSRSLGSKEAMGHSDFYVNNANMQLGCPLNTTFQDVISIDKSSLSQGEILPGCSHKRSFKYFIEALDNKNCSFTGLRCDSFENFTMGKCVSCGDNEVDCRIFGRKTYKGSKQKITYYLNVAERPPFCMFQYQVNIFVKENKNEFTGYFEFIFLDEDGNVAEATLATEPRFRNIKNGNNSFIYYAQRPKLGKIIEAKVKWTEKKKIYCFIYCNLKINVDMITVKLIEKTSQVKRSTYQLCSAEGLTTIENESFRKYISCSATKTTDSLRTTESIYTTESTSDTECIDDTTFSTKTTVNATTINTSSVRLTTIQVGNTERTQISEVTTKKQTVSSKEPIN